MTPPLPGLTVRTSRSLLVVVTALALAGCGSGEDDSGAAGGPASSASPTPTAADGTDLNACKDGTCEVKVTAPAKIPVDRKKFKIHTLKFTAAKDGAASFSIEDPRPVSSLSVRVCDREDKCFVLGGGSYVSGGENQKGGSSTSFTAATGSKITANRLLITVLSAADGSAILSMRPA